MKRTISYLLLTMLCLSATAQTLDWGDQGNGTYKNPVLNADYSDPDVIRVGEKYYMVCSDFQYSIDGSHYESAGDAFPMQEGYWKGIRVGLYAYHTKGSSQTVWFDRFQYDVLH